MISSERSSSIFSPDNDITFDNIYSKNIVIAQNKKGYRFNADSMILSWFIFNFTKKKIIKKMLEIGSGSGVIPLVLAERGMRAQTDCVEIQQSLYELLCYNVQRNGASNINPLFGDFRDIPFKKENLYDIVFTNPPYFPHDKGIVSPDAEKSGAKHETFGNLKDFMGTAQKQMTSTGEFFFIYPLSRIQKALSDAQIFGLFAKDIRVFQEYNHTPPNLFTARLSKGKQGNNCTFNVITMREKDGTYTETGKNILFKPET
jgi:tRNA1Val (adenine37-N6)-methyltransferase